MGERRNRSRGGSALLEAARLRIEELVFNVLVDSRQPLLGALRTIMEMIGIRFELPDALLGGTKLHRQLMRELHGAITIAVCSLSSLLQQFYNGLYRAIDGVAVVPHLLSIHFVGGKRDDFLGGIRITLTTHRRLPMSNGDIVATDPRRAPY